MLFVVFPNNLGRVLLSYWKNLEVSPPRPYQFTSKSLQSTLAVDLTEVVTKVNELMPQFSDFISQFHTVVANNPINIIIEADGYMSLDVPSGMPDNEAQQLSKRIGLLDRLIATRGEQISSLIDKGLGIEEKLKQQDSQFTSQILEKVNEFKRIKNTYRH